MVVDRIHQIDVTLPPSERVPPGAQVQPLDDGWGYVFWMGVRADTFPEWGLDPITRDVELRKFWPSEPFLASAFGSQIARYAGFPFTLDGPSRMTSIYESIFEGCENGHGWQSMMTKIVTDIYTQCNGGWMELIRTSDSPTAPVISMRHMDAGRCRRTGRWDEPCIFYDLYENPHLMKWYQCIEFTELPSPNLIYRGLQVSVLDRILKAAQIMKAIQQFKLERVTGLKHHKLHLIGGFNQGILDDTMKQKLAIARGAGLQNYVDPVILAALNPEGRVTHEEIDLNELPPDFDEEVFMKYYIGNISLAWEDDYTSFFPLPGGNMGTATQSETLQNKSKSKGPAVFMRMVEHKLNYYGVLPKSVKMHYGETDPASDRQKVDLIWRFAQYLKLLLDSSVITPEIGALMLRDAGYLKPEYLLMLGQTDPTPQPVSSDG